MTDWLKQYTSALEARDAREQAHKPYIDAYTLLAEKSKASLPRPRNVEAPRSPALDQEHTPTRRTKAPLGKGTASPTVPTEPDTNLDLQSLRSDLATTQKARAALTTTLRNTEQQLSQLQTERKEHAAQLAALSKAKLETERKLRDRDEELRGKDRLVEQAQDEMVALALQLHVAEEKAEKLTRENQELVDRWMKKVGAEADRVNRDSRWE